VGLKGAMSRFALLEKFKLNLSCLSLVIHVKMRFAQYSSNNGKN